MEFHFLRCIIWIYIETQLLKAKLYQSTISKRNATHFNKCYTTDILPFGSAKKFISCKKYFVHSLDILPDEKYDILNLKQWKNFLITYTLFSLKWYFWKFTFFDNDPHIFSSCPDLNLYWTNIDDSCITLLPYYCSILNQWVYPLIRP